MSRNESPTFGEYKNELEAELLLAKIDLQEDLAMLWAEESCDQLRQKYAEMYQEFIGVLPCQREQFRNELQQVLGSGGVDVQSLVNHFQVNAL